MLDSNVSKTDRTSSLARLSAGNRVEKTWENGRGISLSRIRPGELCKGYLGRIAGSNAVKDLTTLLAEVASLSQFSEAPPEQAMTAILAELTGNQLGAFHAAHTILPFQKAVRPSHLWSPFASTAEPRVALAFQFPSHTSDAPLFLCPSCVAADVEENGTSYWYRSHQLRGVVACGKHGVGLQRLAPRSIDKFPHSLVADSVPLPRDIVDDALSRPLAKRYAQFCEMFATRTEPYTTEQFTTAISNRVRLLDQEATGKPIRVSRYLQDQLGSRWLQECFPKLQRIRGLSNLNSLDRVGIRLDLAYPTPYYALALALLFETVEEASQQLSLESPSTSGPAGGGEAGRPSIDMLAALAAFSNGASIEVALQGRNVRTEDFLCYVRQLVRSSPYANI